MPWLTTSELVDCTCGVKTRGILKPTETLTVRGSSKWDTVARCAFITSWEEHDVLTTECSILWFQKYFYLSSNSFSMAAKSTAITLSIFWSSLIFWDPSSVGRLRLAHCDNNSHKDTKLLISHSTSKLVWTGDWILFGFLFVFLRAVSHGKLLIFPTSFILVYFFMLMHLVQFYKKTVIVRWHYFESLPRCGPHGWARNNKWIGYFIRTMDIFSTF